MNGEFNKLTVSECVENKIEFMCGGFGILNVLTGPDGCGNYVCIERSLPKFHILASHLLVTEKPLAYVEDKPVYKGDKLFVTEKGSLGKEIEILGMEIEILGMDRYYGKLYSERFTIEACNLSWEKPKNLVKYWVNLYLQNGEIKGVRYQSKSLADYAALPSRLACVEVEIEE